MVITQHPEFPNHWYVDGILVAGVSSAEAAEALLDAHVRSGGAEQVMITADDVRLEASRRMQQLLGARDGAHLDILIANATREAVRLLRKGEASWSAAEAARALELESLDQAIESIRSASNAMEAAPPADFRDDAHWPSQAV